jgi:transcriptional regulator with XRE-family HTH domain
VTRRPHGYARYRLDGCRCYVCAGAVSAYDQARARAIAYGTWRPWTDAAPVRAHVHQLQHAGLGTRSIATAAGIPRQVVQYLLTGKPGRPAPSKIRPATAAAILAVDLTLDRLPPNTRVDATGARRRVQALARVGWPAARVAERAGMTRGNLAAALRGDRVTVCTARRIRDAYDALWDADPIAGGVPAHMVERTRQRARTAGWAPPAAWDDDIDDPAARPQGVRKEAS